MNFEPQENRDRNKDIESVYRRFSGAGLLRLKIRRYIRLVGWFTAVSLASVSKRVLDLTLALTFTVLLSPLIVIGWLISGRSLVRTPRLGKWGITFDELSFPSRETFDGRIIRFLHISRLPVLINIIRGDMSFVGPLPASPGDFSLTEKAVRKRYNVRPGIISLWWIRKRANIDYGAQLDVDMEYVQTHSLASDLGICLRAIPAILYGEAVIEAPRELKILGIRIDNFSMAEAIETIVEWSGKSGSRQICFVNADCANIAYRDSSYLNVLNQSSLCFADGIGLKIAGKLLGQQIAQNVNGTDMFPLLCKSLEQTDLRMYLLGARPEVVEGVVNWVRTNYPNLKLCGYHHGYFNTEEELEIIQEIKDSEAHLLLVALGAPRQDMWVNHHLDETGVGVAMGVGGLFDFYSGRISRAPAWMREIGMEWFYRFLQEPGRLWKRYFVGNFIFLSRVLREKFFPRKNQSSS